VHEKWKHIRLCQIISYDIPVECLHIGHYCSRYVQNIINWFNHMLNCLLLIQTLISVQICRHSYCIVYTYCLLNLYEVISMIWQNRKIKVGHVTLSTPVSHHKTSASCLSLLTGCANKNQSPRKMSFNQGIIIWAKLL